MLRTYLTFLGLMLFYTNLNAQEKSVDFGLSTVISVGLQDEWAIGVRSGYQNNRWNYLAVYNLFFRRDVTAQNTETYAAFELSANYRLFDFSGIQVFGGFGYTGNNFKLSKNNPDSSNLFFKTGSLNHGAQIKFLGILPLGERLQLFSELNVQSFGRRYDTFSFGLVYSIPSP